MNDKEFKKETDGIYRLKVPFEDLYTSVFLIKSGTKFVLIDCATDVSDVDEYIEPSLKNFGLNFNDISCLIVTHDHADHSGGLNRILQKNAQIQVIRTPTKMCDIEIYPMSGHTKNFIGVFHSKSKTLISGDGLQGAGIGKYRCGLESKEDYLQTIEKIEQDERIENVLFSHSYEPWYKDGAFGRADVKKILQDCKKYI